MSYENISEFLKNQLEKMRQVNRRASVRSMGRKVNISAGRLSEMLNGKRNLSEYYADKIALGLKLSSADRQELYSLISTHSRKILSEYELLESEIALLSSWEHYAVLSLMTLPEFRSEPSWIAQRLGLSAERAQASLRLLENLNLIKKENGEIKRTYLRLTTSMDVPSSALRESLRQDILKSLDALETVPSTQRDFSSITMGVNPANLKRAKKLIETFRNKMSLLLEEGTQSEVYNLSIQLFPMTQLENKDRQ